MLQQDTSTDCQTPRALVRVWLTGIATWGHAWASALGDSPLDARGQATLAGALWAQELAGFTEAQILDTLAHFRRLGHEWPPSLPMVRAQCVGVPSLAAVRHELRDREAVRTGFTRLVWTYLDTYALRTADVDKADRMIRDAYTLARENLLAGRAVIPEISPALAAPEPVPAGPCDPEHAAAIMAEIRQRLAPDAKTADAGQVTSD